MTTRKHFIQTAEALQNAKPKITPTHKTSLLEESVLRQWRIDCNAIANVLAVENPRFDRLKFLAACGYPRSALAVLTPN